MSNSIGQNLLHQSLLAPTVLIEHQSRSNSSPSCIAGITTLFQPQATSQIRKSTLYTKFRLNWPKTRSPMGNNRLVSVIPQAVLAIDSPSELAGKYNLEGNTELLVNVRSPGPGSLSQLEIQVTNSSDSLVFHWGGIRDKNGKWVLPARQPQGTKVYKNRALRTPFTKSGSNSFLRIEIDDPAIQAIEFLIFDEAQNKWFKHNGDNFHVKLSSGEKLTSNVSVPEDLVQIQAYLRWEKNGKQMYTPEQEKREFEEARKELQLELEKGISLDAIRKKITKGEIQIKISKQVDKKIPFTVERIQRKKRDLMQLLNRYTPGPEPVKETISTKPHTFSTMDLFAKAKEEQSGGPVLRNFLYKLADKELLVLVTKPSGKTRIDMATDFKDPLTLHWALSKNSGEWLAPPPSALPSGSIVLDSAVQTQFSSNTADDLNYTIIF